MIEDITIETLLQLLRQGDIVPIDVRSPSEFAEGTIPGSRNMPIFDDAERAEIGTIYKQQGRQAAMNRGLELVSSRLPGYVRSLMQVEGQKALFCWRGGMRSKAAATFVSLMGIRVFRLIGGIREYRRWVVSELETFKMRPQAVVINGNTGTGKTAILRELASRGYPVLDLEGLAGHRGSIFGGIGLQPMNQKQFDSGLLHELLRLNDRPYVLMEAESKRIGRAVMPEFVVRRKEQGLQFYIELPMAERVRRTLEDYRPWEHPEEILDAYSRIRSRIHTPIAHEIDEALRQARYEWVVELLLEHYYDPRYEYTANQYDQEPIYIQAEDTDEAAERIAGQLDKLFAAPEALSGKSG